VWVKATEFVISLAHMFRRSAVAMKRQWSRRRSWISIEFAKWSETKEKRFVAAKICAAAVALRDIKKLNGNLIATEIDKKNMFTSLSSTQLKWIGLETNKEPRILLATRRKRALRCDKTRKTSSIDFWYTKTLLMNEEIECNKLSWASQLVRVQQLSCWSFSRHKLACQHQHIFPALKNFHKHHRMKN